jgi:hypothetical protein
MGSSLIKNGMLARRGSNSGSSGAATTPTTIKVSLDTADVYSLSTVPITAIAAPGAGKAIVIITALFSYNHNTTSFDTITYLSLGPLTPGGTQFITSLDGTSGINALTIDTMQLMYRTPDTFNTVLGSAVANAAIVIVADSDSAVGDGSIDLYITYQVITL